MNELHTYDQDPQGGHPAGGKHRRGVERQVSEGSQGWDRLLSVLSEALREPQARAEWLDRARAELGNGHSIGTVASLYRSLLEWAPGLADGGDAMADHIAPPAAADREEFVEIIGGSPAILGVLSAIRKVAPTDATVLIQGETGTGKELVARAIHARSPRRGRPMIKVNCAALPTTLIESELFGRERGAYTGAVSRQVGRFEMADHATLFLDEVGELPLDAQVKLLRVLQEGEFERLGSAATRRVDVRVVAATNRDLAAAVREGSFREDLYYRLSVFPISVPPLRERSDDVPMLIWSFVQELCESMGRYVESIPRREMEKLQTYSWPGNIRQLRNTVERAMILHHGNVLHLEPPEQQQTTTDDVTDLAEVERRHIVEIMKRTRWRVRGRQGAAMLLGLKPTTLESRMQKLGIRRPDR